LLWLNTPHLDVPPSFEATSLSDHKIDVDTHRLACRRNDN
jgi:hypothetical protein